MARYPWEKSYPPGVRWELEIPKKTIHQIFEESCAQFGDRPFTDFLDKVMTFRDYKEASDKAAAGFQKLVVGSIADYLPWPKNWLYPIAKKKEIAAWPRDDWHLSFKDLLANDGKYTPHPAGENLWDEVA